MADDHAARSVGQPASHDHRGLFCGLGGADGVTVLPFTAALGLPDAFARRMARSTQLILLEESNLGRVVDPAAGSGGFEALTEALCEKAWTLFQEIEREGASSKALRRGRSSSHRRGAGRARSGGRHPPRPNYWYERIPGHPRGGRERASPVPLMGRGRSKRGRAASAQYADTPFRNSPPNRGNGADAPSLPSSPKPAGRKPGRACGPAAVGRSRHSYRAPLDARGRAVRAPARPLGLHAGRNRGSPKGVSRQPRPGRCLYGPHHLRQELLRGRRVRSLGQRVSRYAADVVRTGLEWLAGAAASESACARRTRVTLARLLRRRCCSGRGGRADLSRGASRRAGSDAPRGRRQQLHLRGRRRIRNVIIALRVRKVNPDINGVH